MEFTNYKCPVCDKQFVSGDDIVVCPECGAPHHRECYDKNGHCFYEEKHSENFSFENIYSENTESDKKSSDDSAESNTVVCPYCKADSPKDAFYCEKCGFPLNEQDRKNQGNAQNSSQNQNVPPYGAPFGANPQQFNMAFDPMAGFKNDEPIGDNVTAGEMSKFIGKSTPYFLRIFGNIKRFNKSRYNFAAFFFSGIYFMYRKMIGLGIIFSILLIGLTVGETFIQYTSQFQSVYNEVLNMSTQELYSLTNSSALLDTFTTREILILYLPSLLSLLKFVMMIVCGCIANRSYYKHCFKKINQIKDIKIINSQVLNTNDVLESTGGVNLPIAICVSVIYIVIMYLPLFIF
ncbi:MAG: hypothetical protein LUF33_09015 [Clostridiales bacterium]|nr:hypothetical protein [Clostridiales bacterium]